MAPLVWDQTGERFYETGVSHGVLYTDGIGVAWNGIISVDQESEATVSPVYFEGRKVNDLVNPGNYKGVLRAFTYPQEFLPFEGIVEDQTGMYLTGQPPGLFGLSYKTKIGNDVDGADHGYKLHVLYNLTAIPRTKSFKSLGLNTEPTQFEWSITGLPEDIDGYRPTAHLIFDSRELDSNLLIDLEDILYGTAEAPASLPSLKSLTSFVRRWGRLIILEYGDGTWSAESPIDGVITMLDSETFQIDTDTATFLDSDTYEIESSEKNEEDLWS